MTMTAVIPEALVITNQPIGQTNIVGSSVTLSVGVSGSLPAYQWYSNNLQIAGATLSSYSIPGARSQDSIGYYVVVTNVLGAVTSAVASVAIVSDTFPIALVSAFAGPPVTSFPNQVIITFSKALRIEFHSPSTNPANYQITILGSANTVSVTNLVYGGRQIRLGANQDFICGTNYVLTVNNVTGTNLTPIAPNSQIGIATFCSAGGSKTGAIEKKDSVPGAPIQVLEVIRFPPGSPQVHSALVPIPRLVPRKQGGKLGRRVAGPPGTLVSLGLITYYFRTTFFRPGLPASGVLRIRHLVDDAAVFYLNGTEILRFGFAITCRPYITPSPAKALGFQLALRTMSW